MDEKSILYWVERLEETDVKIDYYRRLMYISSAPLEKEDQWKLRQLLDCQSAYIWNLKGEARRENKKKFKLFRK